MVAPYTFPLYSLIPAASILPWSFINSETGSAAIAIEALNNPSTIAPSLIVLESIITGFPSTVIIVCPAESADGVSTHPSMK